MGGLQLLQRGLDARILAAIDHDPGAAAGEAEGDGVADAGGGTGDDGRLAVEIYVQALVSL